jgi:uncharacterized metal-binding protein
MPNGKTHDRLTAVTAALSVPLWYIASPAHDPLICIVGVGSYLFSGFWLSDDLDTNSICYKRWGLFKFIWWPYRILVPHRSCLSHGLVIGPILRVIYFTTAVYVTSRVAASIIGKYVFVEDRTGILRHCGSSLSSWLVHHPAILAAAAVGLVLGGFTHTAADVLASFWKRVW